MPEFDYTDYGPKYKDIPGFPGYRAGTDGSIWSCRRVGRPRVAGEKFSESWHELKPGIQDNNAVHIAIRGRLHLVHRLTLIAFVGPCPDGMECCHADDNRLNNKLSNLRWDTHSANCVDRKQNGKEIHPSKLTNTEAASIRCEYATGKTTQRKLAEKHRVSQSLISLIILRQIWV